MIWERETWVDLGKRLLRRNTQAHDATHPGSICIFNADLDTEAYGEGCGVRLDFGKLDGRVGCKIMKCKSR